MYLKMQVIGHLGGDAVIKKLEDGNTVINFSVAHTEKYSDKSGEQVEKTVWVNASFFTEKTKITEYLTKGKLVMVEGIPAARAYKDQDGAMRSSLNMKVGLVRLLGSSDRKQDGNGQEFSQNETPVVVPNDLPFD